MVSRRFDEELKKSRTITLQEFVDAQSEVLGDFIRVAIKEPGGGAEAIFPVMMILPAIMARLARTLFDEAEPAMDETQDADRVEKKE